MGIPYVIVNSTIVVKDTEVLKGVNPGQPIWFESVKRRFEPISVEAWKNVYMVSPVEFGGTVPYAHHD